MVKKLKQVSNEDLARMIATGFDEVDKSLGGVNESIATIDDRLRVVETKIDRALYTDMTRIEARVKKLEEKVGIK